MKTTVEIADDVLLEFKSKVAEQDLSMRAALDEALRLWLEETREPSPPLDKDVGIAHGKGLSKSASRMSWDELREVSYDRS